MSKKVLSTVTLLGIDCIDIDRLMLAAEICQQGIKFGEVKMLTSLDPQNYQNIVKIDPINSVEEYSRFVLLNLDDYINTSHVLVIQYDGFILNSDSWTDEFLKYDYIGAPWLVADWSVKNFDFPPELLGKLVVGNGGFSLRSKKLTKLCKSMMQQKLFPRFHPEDVAVAVYQREYLASQGITFAPIPLAKQFSFEAEDDKRDMWDGQLGFHGLAWTDISKWNDLHQEYEIQNPAADKKKNINTAP